MNSSLQTNWITLFEKTVATLQQDENYMQYSVREKMLAFVYTMLQNMNEDSIYFSSQIKHQRIPFLPNHHLKELKLLFINYSDALIFEGTNSGEIQARPLIANYYQQILWNAIVSILYFWSNDTSEQKENTDVMVEKTIHFIFDLLAPNPIDSGFDLVQHFFKLRNK